MLSSQIRRAFRSIRNTLPDILYVFLLFIFSVLIFSLMALKLFGDRGLKTVQGSPYFTNILDIAFELYVLVTTANSPDVMYNEIRTLAYLKRHKMIEAFNILKVKVGTEFVVKEAQWRQLAKVVEPDISSSHLELLLRISDEGQKGFRVIVTTLINIGPTMLTFGGLVLTTAEVKVWSSWPCPLSLNSPVAGGLTHPTLFLMLLELVAVGKAIPRMRVAALSAGHCHRLTRVHVLPPPLIPPAHS
eukprot:bmy_08326T0